MRIIETHTSRIAEGVGSIKGQKNFADNHDMVTTETDLLTLGIGPKFLAFVQNLMFSV